MCCSVNAAELLPQNCCRRIVAAELLPQNYYRRIITAELLPQNYCRRIIAAELLGQSMRACIRPRTSRPCVRVNDASTLHRLESGVVQGSRVGNRDPNRAPWG